MRHYLNSPGSSTMFAADSTYSPYSHLSLQASLVNRQGCSLLAKVSPSRPEDSSVATAPGDKFNRDTQKAPPLQR